MLVGGGLFSTCVCVFSLLGPSRRLQPWTGQKGHRPRLQLQMRGPSWGEEGQVEVQAGPGASQHRRSAVLLRRRAVGLELARRSQCSPSESTLRAGPTPGGLAPSTRFRVAVPLL